MSEGPKVNSIESVLSKRPEFTNDTPLDRFFEALSEYFLQIKDDSGIPLYEELGCANNTEFVESLLERLVSLKTILKENSGGEADNSLMPISLHDMKYFDLLVNLIVVHGIYANLPLGIGVPLDQRRIGNFRQVDKRFEIHSRSSESFDTLSRVSDVLYDVLTYAPLKENTVGSLLLKGTGFADLITALVVLYHEVQGSRDRIAAMFERVESLQETYQLFSVYTLLVHTTSKSEYRQFVLTKLSTLSTRRDNGVISLVDFVVGVREDEEIDVTKFKRVAEILVSKPKSMTSVTYFTELFDQIYDGLTFVNKPILVSCLNNVVNEFYFKNKKIIYDFLFKRIATVLYNTSLQEFSAKTLNDTINVLISLSKNPSIEVTHELVKFGGEKFYLTLWIYCLFLKKHQRLQPSDGSQQPSVSYYNVILGMLKTYIIINSDYKALDDIVLNLVNFDHETWGYGIDFETQLPYVRLISEENVGHELTSIGPVNPDQNIKRVQQVFSDIDCAVLLFVELLKLLNEPEVVKEIFLSVMNRWVVSTNRANKEDSQLPGDFHNSLLVLVDLKLLEKMDEGFKNDIIKKPRDVLKLINDLLEFPSSDEVEQDDQPDSDDDDNEEEGDEEEDFQVEQLSSSNTYITLLKLLSAIITTTSRNELHKSSDILESISKTLHGHSNDPQVQSVVGLINNFQSKDAYSGQPVGDFSELDADNEFLQKALANVNDALVPVRAHGLYELRQLIERKSPVIDLKYVLEVHARQLHDKEPFVYLNAIKGLTSLCEIEPEMTLSYLLNLFRNPGSKNSLDDTLKVGEVLLNYITIQNELFGGESAGTLVAICLEKIQQHENLDNRLRMSAMSILGVCLQTNPWGVRSQIPDILDCAFGILKLENRSQNSSSNLVRRSAVHLLHSLVSSSRLALFPPQYDRLRLVSFLSYVKETDDDYLVCEQADTLITAVKACEIS
ncbi:LAQU0S08e02828g1_1 [Lachancea quebecensis]|uniref:LAQU0S08e02828g1_1 n=1 Tax=Lachancea quebecensis TaxID=1654605 RepID=A0A0P1KTI7_9SACH|nr:LAQU0S08e02828g1_1 [Lachancea quebecensis]